MCTHAPLAPRVPRETRQEVTQTETGRFREHLLSQKEQIWFVVVLESMGKESKCQVSENFTAFVFSFLSTSQQHSCARDGLGPDCCVASTQACASSSRSCSTILAKMIAYLCFALQTYSSDGSPAPIPSFYLGVLFPVRQ